MDDKGKAPMYPGSSSREYVDEGESSSATEGGLRWGAEPSSSSAVEEAGPGASHVTIAGEAQSGAPKAPVIKSALAGKGKSKSKGWGKMRMAKTMNTMKGNLANMTEELREEAKRNTKLRMAAMKKMEERNRQFTTGTTEYKGVEYLPDMSPDLMARLSTPTGPGGGKSNKVDPVLRKQQMVYAALRGRLPKLAEESQQAHLADEAVDDLTLEVALEETAEITTGKDGKIRKQYGGLKGAMGNAMLEMKKDFLGRAVHPWKTLSREERWWIVTSWMFMVADFAAAVFFLFLAFEVFKDDRKMDPLAWQLTFGSTAVFIGLHFLVLLLEFIDYFAVYIIMVMILVCGLFYGSVTYFLRIYTGEFSCFHYTGIESYAYGICYEGRLLVGLMVGVMYLLLAILYLWRWRKHKRLQRKKRGDYAAELELEELLERVDAKFERYRLLETGQIGTQVYGKTNMSFALSEGDSRMGSPVSRGIFDKKKPTSDRADSSENQSFVTRLMNIKPGTTANMTSTMLRGVPHAKPSSPTSSASSASPASHVSRFSYFTPGQATVRPEPSAFHNTAKHLARRTSVTVHKPEEDVDDGMDKLKMVLGNSKYRGTQITTHQYDPNADNTARVGVGQAGGGGGEQPSIMAAYNTTSSLVQRADQPLRTFSKKVSSIQRNRVLNKVKSVKD